ncbi:MAG: insulinase family protein [Gammaproteobacteria bacterium]|nr:insulinase family protein [Gammaproteobacteria bacterium]
MGIALLCNAGVYNTLAHAELLPATTAANVTVYELDNGMRILVLPDHRAPVVVSQVWYRVGSSYEHNGVTGISHMLEHMMFKGTKKLKPGEFSEIIAFNGGEENAFTGTDYTAYFQTIAADRLELCLRLEAERMRNLKLDETELKKELQVVKEERRMRTEDNPQALTFEQFQATAFVNSPYHHPIIGWMDDITNYKVNDAREWYDRWYAPNNAILVVVGDVQPAAVYALAKKYFGKLKPSLLVPPKTQIEIPQLGERRIKVHAPAEVPYVVLGYPVPVLKTAKEAWQVYALDVLAGVLDGGDSARLSRELIRGQQIAAQVSVSYDMYDRLNSSFVLSAVPNDNKKVADIETALRQQLNKLKTHKISAEELARVKAQVLASEVYQRDSMFYQGMRLGLLEAVGLGWQRADEYVAGIKAVTAEQVQSVAKEYFVDQHVTVAELVPQSSITAPNVSGE